VIRYRLSTSTRPPAISCRSSCTRPAGSPAATGEALQRFIHRKHTQIVHDKDGLPVYMAPSAYMLELEMRENPAITFHTHSEFKTVAV
jgi:peptide subunit release factor RF-3